MMFGSCFANPVARFSTAPIFPSRRRPPWTARSRDSRCTGWGTDMASGCVSRAPLGERVRAKTIERFCAPTTLAQPLARRTRGLLSDASIRTCALGLALIAAAGRASVAQDKPSDHFNLDKLEIVSLGASMGRILVSQTEPTTLYAVQADYGEVAPGWHVVFGTSYWESRFRDGVVQAFVDSLQKSVADPTGTARVVASR